MSDEQNRPVVWCSPWADCHEHLWLVHQIHRDRTNSHHSAAAFQLHTHTHTYIHIHEGVEQSVSIGSNCSINHRLQKTAQDFVGHWVSMVLYTTMTSCLWLCRLSKMSLIPSKLQNHDIMFLTNLVQQHTPCRTLRSASAKLLSLTHCNLSFHARARGLSLADAAIWNSE